MLTRRLAVVARPVRRAGFTLTEILLVLAILGVIAAMVVPNLLGRQKEALDRTTKQSILAFETALQQYAINNMGDFPQMSQEEVVNLLVNPGQDSSGRQIAAYLPKAPKDAWDQPLYYEWPNSKGGDATKPAIWSSGQNRQNEDGGGDDISNWK